MSSTGADRRGLAQRIEEARHAYRGPFTGTHIQALLENLGYVRADEEDREAFLVFKKDGCRLVPINPAWETVRDNDPIFRCLQRDLGMNRWQLRLRLNQMRKAN